MPADDHEDDDDDYVVDMKPERLPRPIGDEPDDLDAAILECIGAAGVDGIDRHQIADKVNCTRKRIEGQMPRFIERYKNRLCTHARHAGRQQTLRLEFRCFSIHSDDSYRFALRGPDGNAQYPEDITRLITEFKELSDGVELEPGASVEVPNMKSKENALCLELLAIFQPDKH